METTLFQIMKEDLICPVCHKLVQFKFEDESAKIKKIIIQPRKNKFCLKFIPIFPFQNFNEKSLLASFNFDGTQKITHPLREALLAEEFYFTCHKFCSDHYLKLYVISYNSNLQIFEFMVALEEVLLKDQNNKIELTKFKQHLVIQTNIENLTPFQSIKNSSLELSTFPLDNFEALITKIQTLTLLS